MIVYFWWRERSLKEKENIEIILRDKELWTTIGRRKREPSEIAYKRPSMTINSDFDFFTRKEKNEHINLM